MEFISKNPSTSKSIKCNVCDQSFTNVQNLSRHQKSVHGDVVDHHKCVNCQAIFSRKDNLKRHLQLKACHRHIPLISENKCEICGLVFTNRSNFLRHNRMKHGGEEQHHCIHCDIQFARKDIMDRHLKTGACKALKRKSGEEHHSDKKIKFSNDPRKADLQIAGGQRRISGQDASPSTRASRSAFSGKLKDVFIQNEEGYLDIKEFLNEKKITVSQFISSELSNFELKVNLRLLCLYEKNILNDVKIDEKCFKTCNTIILKSTDIDNVYSCFTDKLLAESSEFEQKESGWTLVQIKGLEVRTNKYNPLGGSSYLELPLGIQAKKAIINVKNQDFECFKWSVLSALHPVQENAHRVSNYMPFSNELNFSGISFPISLKNIPRFEKLNDISINVYSYTEKLVIYPLLITEKERSRHVDLLFLKNDHNEHYCWIKDLSRLVSSQISKHKCQKYICRHCLLHFGKEEFLLKHKEICYQNDSIRVQMPENKWLKFENFRHIQKVPFVVYADFECYTAPIAHCDPSSHSSFMSPYQQHKPMSFCYYIILNGNMYKPPVVYRGPNAGKVFFEMLKSEAREVEEIYSITKPMTNLNQEAEMYFRNAETCYICKNEFSIANHKVKDHCHITGLFRGAACNTCNLKCKLPDFLPILLHNLTNYDLHLFVKEFGSDDREIQIIPHNEEKYISISKSISKKIKLRFLDSFRFMPGSLENLGKNLSKEQFVHTQTFFTSDKVELLLRKGVYPYDYMSDESKCADTSLPSKELFYSKLNESDISDSDYEHAENVWNSFNINNLGEYSDLYVKSDVLLLSDIFENFRELCMKTYNLDPVWYFTAPGLSWDAMLKITGVNIELFTDYDMLLFVEKGIRGGISQCSHRYAKANNKYMENYDPKEPSNYLLYLDANNLYGWAMSQYLPLNNFSWSPTQIDVRNISNNSDIGFILEVDIDYPIEIHDNHSDLPLAPENIVPRGCKEKRLLTTLYNKEKYVIHYRNLKQCIQQGLKVRKIHRILQFNQKPWLKPYIELNTNLRCKSKNTFEKNFYKLMNNAIFGKTMENIRRRVDIRLCSSSTKLEKLISKPNFQCRTIFDNNLVAVHMKRTCVTFNKPMIVGMSILDVSKTLMYDFHYSVMKPKYEDCIRLLYTDTDSLIYSIKTEDIYQDMKENISFYDTSDYPENNIFNMPLMNKKVLGKMKDECSGEIMTEFIGLRSKMYAYKIQENKICKKLKGVKKSCIEKKIKFEDYYRCLFEEKELIVKMNLIRSNQHDVFSITQNKLALSSKDEKRYVLNNKINTLAFGHHEID